MECYSGIGSLDWLSSPFFFKLKSFSAACYDNKQPTTELFPLQLPHLTSLSNIGFPFIKSFFGSPLLSVDLYDYSLHHLLLLYQSAPRIRTLSLPQVCFGNPNAVYIISQWRDLVLNLSNAQMREEIQVFNDKLDSVWKGEALPSLTPTENSNPVDPFTQLEALNFKRKMK